MKMDYQLTDLFSLLVFQNVLQKVCNLPMEKSRKILQDTNLS